MTRRFPRRTGRRRSRLVLLLSMLGFWSCATVRPPSLQVQNLKFNRPGLTGASMEVAFQVRNTNPDPLYVERFEYELSLNGRKLGRGFYPDALELGAFRDQRVVSRFDINFLRLPGVVQQLLERDKVKAEVEGTFYVRRGSGIQKLRFRNDAEVDLNR